jgi:hypothetical protein
LFCSADADPFDQQQRFFLQPRTRLTVVDIQFPPIQRMLRSTSFLILGFGHESDR